LKANAQARESLEEPGAELLTLLDLEVHNNLDLSLLEILQKWDGDLVRVRWEHGVVMRTHGGLAADVNTKRLRQQAQSVAGPLFAMAKVVSGYRSDATSPSQLTQRPMT
jgi:hypothetical protein